MSESYWDILENVNIDLFIKNLVNDSNISDKSWDKKYQHLRDDLCLVKEGKIDLKNVLSFHKKTHNINGINLLKRYNLL